MPMIIIPADAKMYIFLGGDVGLLHGKMIDFTIFDKNQRISVSATNVCKCNPNPALFKCRYYCNELAHWDIIHIYHSKISNELYT